MKIELDYKPTIAVFEKIEKMISKEKGNIHSLYYNWEFVTKLYKEGTFAALKINDTPIGYIAWRETDTKSISLEYIWIDILYRGYGCAQTFMKEIISHFQSCGYALLTLFACSKDGDTLSNRMGFIPYEVVCNKDSYCRYLPLIPYQKVSFTDIIVNAKKYIEYGPDINPLRRRVILDNIHESSPLLIDIPSNWNIELFSNNNCIVSTQSKRLNHKTKIEEISGHFFIFNKDSF